MFSVSMSNKYHHTHPIQGKEYLEELKIELENSLQVKKKILPQLLFSPLDFTSLLYSIQCPTVLLKFLAQQRRSQG